MEVSIIETFVTLGITIPLVVAIALYGTKRSAVKGLDKNYFRETRLAHLGNKISEFIAKKFKGVSNINQITFSINITKEFLRSLNKWKKRKEWKDKKITQLENYIFILGSLTIIFTIVSICSFIFFRQSHTNKSIIDEKISIIILIFTIINIVCSALALMIKSAGIKDALSPKSLD